ncbi:MAG: hypothetical protein JNJ59_06560 [Deltaproteobacteria bacterium]|nr:hypothetical protein [Deltaproteobacteria bacterium]
MKLRSCLVSLFLVATACGDSSSTLDTKDSAAPPDGDVTSDVEPDAPDSAEPSDGVPDGASDTSPEVVDDTSDTADSSDAPDTTPPRPSSFRAIGGMSMGAAAIDIALEEPATFDMVGALGGYADTTYMMAQMLRLHFQGFCPLEALETAARAGTLDDPTASPPVTCGPSVTRHALEVPMDWNHLRYDTNGITMTRGFYGEIIDNFSAAYGNLSVIQHPDAPLLPDGIDLAWWNSTSPAERCAHPRPIETRRAFNAEYNPDGLYPVIPLCDIDQPVTPGLLPSEFDVAAPRNRSIAALLAVDINGNGRRDLGEPLFLNPWERYQDVGLDGCPNAYEDGLGGCIDATSRPIAPPPSDPNGDDFDWVANPDGLENNDRYDLGEPFQDFGLDGVPASRSGFADDGEGNGVWDAVPAFQRLLTHDADTKLRTLPAASLEHLDVWVDAGIRDVLDAGVVARNLVAALRSRGREPVVYHDFAGKPGALVPSVAPNDLVNAVFSIDWSPAAVGRDLYIEYGDPAATQAQIDAGDGKHVGTEIDALNRIATFLSAAILRMPEPDYTPYELPTPLSATPSFYSAGLHARRGYTIAFPPGYWEPENAERRYPVIYFLHGLGQAASDLGPAALVTGILMSDGRLPKALIVFPDGACCFVDKETGLRECACGTPSQGVRMCVDPACEGPEETCAVRPIPDSRLERECHKGSLFADMAANRWGEPRTDLGYKTSVRELVHEVDKTFRVRHPTR